MRLSESAMLVLALGIAAGGCTESVHPREELLGLSAEDPVQRHFAEPARLTVVYWPAIDGCGPCEADVAGVLAEAERQNGGDTRVLTVIPTGAGREFAEAFRVDWPGKLVELDPTGYQRQRSLGPLPRVEVWGASGDLLLLRSLPSNLAAGDLLAEEILWCRFFTAPLETTGGLT